MTTAVRRCTKCGREDLHEQWSSIEEAADAGALRGNWACPSCAWPEAEIVESTGTPASSADPAEGGVPATEEPGLSSDPQAPISPDEGRRSADRAGLPR